MRILHLLPHLSGGGAERQFSYLATELAHMGHKVNVGYLSNGPSRPEMTGVTRHQLASINNYDPYLIWQLVRLIQRVKPDIVHTWILLMDILGGMAARLNGLPWIFREPNSSRAYSHTWKQRLRVWVGSGASAIVSNSRGGDEYWKLKLPYSRRYVIQNGLPVPEIDAIVAALPPGLAEPEAPIVLYVGRLIAHKNLKILLEVLACVRKQQKIVGVLCGDGPQRSELEVIRHKLGLDADVHFTGYLPAALVWALMKKASLFVSISAYEGCPNTVMEAIACGCPVVLSDIPAHREILDVNSALFVDPSNFYQTVDTITQVLKNLDDTTKRALVAKRKTQQWSIPKMARSYERVYMQIIAHHSQIAGKRRKATIGQKDNS